jgi:hypothetical protein
MPLQEHVKAAGGPPRDRMFNRSHLHSFRAFQQGKGVM